MGWMCPTDDTFEHEEHVAWRQALIDTIEFMFWMRKGGVVPLINTLHEVSFQTRFRDMRLFTPIWKQNLLEKRGIKKKLVIQPFDTTIRRPGRYSPRSHAATRKSEYFGERDDRSPF